MTIARVVGSARIVVHSRLSRWRSKKGNMCPESKTVDLVRYVKKLKIRKQDISSEIENAPEKKEQLEDAMNNLEDQITSVEKVISDLKQSNLRRVR